MDIKNMDIRLTEGSDVNYKILKLKAQQIIDSINCNELVKQYYIIILKYVCLYEQLFANIDAYVHIEIFNKIFYNESIHYNLYEIFTSDYQTQMNFIHKFYNHVHNYTYIPQNNIIHNRFDIIKQLYGLNDIEYRYLLIIYAQSFPLVNNLLRITSKNILWNIIIANETNVDKSSLINKLISIGLIKVDQSVDVYTGQENYVLTDNILKVINTCDTIQQSLHALLDSKDMDSDLTLSDFNHVNYKTFLKIYKMALKKNIKGINFLFYGPVGSGKTEFCKVISKKLNVNIFNVTSQLSSYKEAQRSDRLVDLQSKLHLLNTSNMNNKCAILFDEADDVLVRPFYSSSTFSKDYINTILENNNVPVIWITNDIAEINSAFLRRMTYCIKFDKLNEQQKLTIWKNNLRQHNLKLKPKEVKELSKKYNVSTSIITNAIMTTKLINGGNEELQDILKCVGSAVYSDNHINTFTDDKDKNDELNNYRIDLINCKPDINDLTEKIKQCGKLNFSLCLYGQPGTGKSLYAKYLAKQLNIPVVYKRASDIFSKWVGETEQNIKQLFTQGTESKSMIILDEVDSFLYNRNNNLNSWELSSVNEMLTQMESYNYPFICTTNLIEILDKASLRRFTFKLHFDFMDPTQVRVAFKHFFNIDTQYFIYGLTLGDFSVVKKKIEFLNIHAEEDIIKMLQEEVDLKDKSSIRRIGF